MASNLGTAAASLQGVLLPKLKKDLQSKNLTSAERASITSTIRALSRDSGSALGVLPNNGVETLARYGLRPDEDPTEQSRDALRALSNFMIHEARVRQDFVDANLLDTIKNLYKKNNSADDEFLYSRLVFLSSQAPSVDVVNYLRELNIHEVLSRSLHKYAEAPNHSLMETMAVSESLKLPIPLIQASSPNLEAFSDLQYPLWRILVAIEIDQTSPTGTSPTRNIIDLLANLDLDVTITFPQEAPARNVEKLADILDAALRTYKETTLDQQISPLILLLNQCAKLASGEGLDYMQKRLLPSAEERQKPLGQSETTPARLLRASTSGHTPILRDSIPILMFKLSGDNAEQFVRNVGYGYASGFLANGNVSAPEPSSAAQAEGKDINFVTGQYLENEPRSKGPPMTEDEKMREAERLFVLFERLKKTGVMNVKNPVEEAIQSGRFEELPDD